MHIAHSCQGISDEDLVARSLKSKDNFACLIDRYEAKLLRYIQRITNVSAEDAQDILQDSFIKIYVNLNDFDRDLKFSSWVYRITHNQVISNYRKRSVRPEGNLIDLEDGKLESFMSDIDIIGDLNNKFERKSIERILDEMDLKYREVLVLKFFEDMDYEEISDIIRKPIGTVATLIHRGKKQFAQVFMDNSKTK